MMAVEAPQVQSPVEAVRRYLDTVPQDFSVREELCSYRFWKAARAEVMAAMFLVIFGCSTITSPSDDTCHRCLNNCTARSHPVGRSSSGSDLRAALALGFTVTTLVQCVGNVSGCHLNPAVTVAMLVTRNISLLRSAVYVMCQFLGALLGALVLGSLGSEAMGVTCVGVGVSGSQAFGVEFLATFLVVFATMATLEPQRLDAGFKAMSIGLSYTVGHLFGYEYTGASMNPARSLGPAVVFNTWDYHWVYWVGPILGAILAGFTYEYTHDSSPQGHFLRRSFRRKGNSRDLRREVSMFSSNTMELNTPCGSHDGRM